MSTEAARTQDPIQTRLHSNGFVVLPEFLRESGLMELHAHVDRFLRDVLPLVPDEHVFYEAKDDPTSLKQVQQLGVYDPWFNDLISTGQVRALAEHLLDGPVVPRNIQYFDKPPMTGRPTPAHQDGHYFKLDPCEALTMWLALDEVDEANGCVRYVRESHKLGLRDHGRTETLGFSQGITDYPTSNDLRNEVAVPAQPGDLLVHHASTIHRADGNPTPDRHRRALGFIYYAERAREDVEASAAYQRDLIERLRHEGKL